MSELLRVNGKALTDLGVWVTAVGQIWSPPGRDYREVAVAGRMGVHHVTPPIGRAQVLTVTLVLEGAVSERRARLDALWRHLRGLLELEVSDLEDRTYWGFRLEAGTGALFPSQSFVETSGDLEVQAEFALIKPGSLHKDVTVLALPAGVEVGADPGTIEDHKVHAVYRFPGDTTDLEVAVLDGITGEERRKLNLTGSTTGEILEIDTSVPAIAGINTATGARTSRMALYLAGGFPALRSEWGTTEHPPRVRANHDGEITYRRAYQ